MKGNVSVICINMTQGESNPSHLQSYLWSAEGNVRICGWYERSRDGPTRRVATTDALLTCSPKTHPHHLSNFPLNDAFVTVDSFVDFDCTPLLLPLSPPSSPLPLFLLLLLLGSPPGI